MSCSGGTNQKFEVYGYNYGNLFAGPLTNLSYVRQHKNQIVNEELWNEARTYGDIQLMPFVDYYNLITFKTLAICIFGVHICLFF